MADSKLNLAMDPWLAMGHISYFLHLANNLAKRGYRISFFVPVRTQIKLERLSTRADLVTFVPVPIPHVEGLPPGAETTADVPSSPMGIKTVYYVIVSPASIGYITSVGRHPRLHEFIDNDFMVLPTDFPDSASRVREIERPYIEYLKSQYGKPVLLAGPFLPGPPASTLDERWVKWQGGFKASSVVYCAFGSEYILEQQQYEELLHGQELTGMPFLAALKQPIGANSGAKASPNEIVATVLFISIQ